MSRDTSMYLQDMLVCCHRILDFTAGLDQELFQRTQVVHWATVKNIEILGEAARHVPDEVRALLPGVDWTQTVATRNILTHAYFGINNDILRDIIETNIPDLERELKAFLHTT